MNEHEQIPVLSGEGANVLAAGFESGAVLLDNPGSQRGLTKQAEQVVLNPDMAMFRSLGFFGAVGEDSLARVREREIAGGNGQAGSGQRFLQFAQHGFRLIGKEAGDGIGAFEQDRQKKVFGLDPLGSAHLRFRAGTKDHESGSQSG